MKLKIGSVELQSAFAFLLPVAIILSQWISIAGINFSWLLYIALFCFMFFRVDMIRKNPGFAVFLVIIAVTPIVGFPLGIANNFDFNLFFSLLTGFATLFFICSMSQKEYSSFMKGLMLSCFLFAVWGCYEIFTGHYILFSNDAFFKRNWAGLYYPGVAFANTNDLVQYLVLFVPISICSVLDKHKLVAIPLVLMTVFVIYQADSKLGMISFFIILFISYILNLLKIKDFGKSISRIIIICSVVFVALLILELITGAISSIFENFLLIDSQGDYFTSRAYIYENLVEFIFTHPLGGFGSSYNVTGITPHNLLLFIFCDFGWIPGIAFVFAIVRMSVFTWKKTREQNCSFLWFVLFSALCVILLTTSISSCNEQRKAVWMFLAICIRNVYVAPFDGSNKFESELVRFKIV